MFFSNANLLQLFVKLFVEAGYFFVPSLVLIGLFNKNALKKDSSRKVFFFISASLLLSYLVFGNSSSRYLLIPTLIVGCFSGAGLDFIVNFVSSLCPRVKRIKYLLATVLTFAIVLICIFRCVSKHRDECMDVFSKLISMEQDKPNIVFGINSHSSQKLGGILNKDKETAFYNCNSWEEAFSRFIPIQTTDNNFFFCVEMKKYYSLKDYINWFQSCYYIFPFQVVCEAFKGNKRFALLKFNRKTMDGNEDFVSPTILDSIPDPLSANKWKSNFSYADINSLFPSRALTDEHFFELTNGTKIYENIYVRLDIQPSNKPLTFILRNAIFWPEAKCDRFLVESLTAERQINNLFSEKQKPTAQENSCLLPSIASPVLLDTFPDCPIIVSNHSPYLHFSGAIPAWFSGNKRFLINQTTEERIHVNADSNKKKFIIEDRYLKKKIEKEIDLIFVTRESNQNIERPVSVLILDEKESSNLIKLHEILPSFLPQDSLIDHLSASIDRLSLDSLSTKYDYIILNPFVSFINKPWDFPFETDYFFENDFEKTFNKIKGKYPDANICIVLPPAPPPAPTFFPTCFSPKSARLSHYRVCSAAIRWYYKNQLDHIILVPLYLYADPDEDYTFQWTIDNERILLGYSFNEKAQEKLSAILIDYIITSFYNNNLFQQAL